MKKTSIRILAIAIGVAALAGIAGCNTMNGLGKDVERAGEKMQEVSKK